MQIRLSREPFTSRFACRFQPCSCFFFVLRSIKNLMLQARFAISDCSQLSCAACTERSSVVKWWELRLKSSRKSSKSMQYHVPSSNFYARRHKFNLASQKCFSCSRKTAQQWRKKLFSWIHKLKQIDGNLFTKKKQKCIFINSNAL